MLSTNVGAGWDGDELTTKGEETNDTAGDTGSGDVLIGVVRLVEKTAGGGVGEWARPSVMVPLVLDGTRWGSTMRVRRCILWMLDFLSSKL